MPVKEDELLFVTHSFSEEHIQDTTIQGIALLTPDTNKKSF